VAHVRCPYCIHEQQFRPMIQVKDGSYECETCDHMTSPGMPTFKCNCKKCVTWRRDIANQDWILLHYWTVHIQAWVNGTIPMILESFQAGAREGYEI